MSDRKLKMLSIFILETKGTKNDKNLNFLKGCFSVMGGPMDMIFCVFSKTYVRLVKSIILQFFSKYKKSYNNLNLKSSLKLNGLSLNHSPP